MYKRFSVLWKFSRPHTIIGSTISIVVLWLMALEKMTYAAHLPLLFWTLLVGITCNVFIVGLNQIIDIDLDKINKPKLPLADGSLTISNAYKIILASLVISLVVSFLTSVILGWLIIVILLVGIAYSVPPIQLKKHHLPAAIAITSVRGLLVNLGMFLHFYHASGQIYIDQILQSPFELIPYQIWMLTSFVVAFSIAIAWFKDLPDTEGDAQFRYNTLAIVYSPKVALYGGGLLVGLAYVMTILWSLSLENVFLAVSHLLALIAFLINFWFVDLRQSKTITRFYMVFWLFFFLEYIFFGMEAMVF
ncbi:MAG TPA: homogentisate phytyltransferase [Saprospiraceae bacterium]|nr:homogentisate phytyltransferase [Saprospiraceae bacterium]